MTTACSKCGADFERVRSPVCPACRYAARLENVRRYMAGKRAALAAQSPELREAHRQAVRARYRRDNPLPACVTCGKPCARVNTSRDICDDCAPDRAARIAKRERNQRAYWARKGKS